MEEDKVGIFSKGLDLKHLFMLKIKINKAQAAHIRNVMQISSTFITISGSIPEVKMSALINDYEHIIAYWEESEQSKV